MGYNLIEISSDKVETLSENIEKGLRYIGKAMQCLDEMKQEEGMMGERRGGRYGNRYGIRYGGRMGMREDGMEDADDMHGRGEMGMRGGNMGYRDPYYY